MKKFLIALLAAACAAAVVAAAKQAPEAASLLGRELYSQADEKGEVAEAQKKLESDPKSLDLILALGRAQASIWRYRDAIATYSRGIEMYPEQAALYRHRGHRYISIRKFDEAVADLERAAALKDDDFDIWYHLALARYLRGEFDKAADAYEKCRAAAKNDDSLIAVSDWLYMTYRRLGKESAAAGVLERITSETRVAENKAYFDRLQLYKGLKKESEFQIPEKVEDLDAATLMYGIGNWHLYNGRKDKAREYFERIAAARYWPAFAVIATEAELKRMR